MGKGMQYRSREVYFKSNSDLRCAWTYGGDRYGGRNWDGT